MSPPQAFLESLHSALIDELNTRHPEIKPELGLPNQDRQWIWPTSEPGALLLAEAFVGGARMIAAILMDQTATHALGYAADNLWTHVLTRARKEFERRAIMPVIENHTLFCYDEKDQAGDSVPPECEDVTRQIWIPLRMGQRGCCWLGLGMVRPQTVH